MIFISRPKFTLNHWFLFLCFAHQAPTYLPLLCRCSLPSLAAWYTLYSDDAVILLLRIRPFCKPRGVLQSAPSKTMIYMSTATCSFFHRNRKRGKGRRTPYIGPVFVTFLHRFSEGEDCSPFHRYLLYLQRGLLQTYISKFHCKWYSSSLRWEKKTLLVQPKSSTLIEIQLYQDFGWIFTKAAVKDFRKRWNTMECLSLLPEKTWDMRRSWEGYKQT